jgi:hypothetical protein
VLGARDVAFSLARSSSRPLAAPRALWSVASTHGARPALPAAAAACDAESDDSAVEAEVDDSKFGPEHYTFWHGLMRDCITLPSAQRILPHLDPQNPLGINVKRSGVSDSDEGLYNVMKREKAKHPRKMLLVRVGEFYETYGFDAALLVQFAGLNPMGARPFKAGTPVVNLRSTLDKLLHHGFSVAVVEEAPQERLYGQTSARKTRYLAGIVTPSTPDYVHGLAKLDDDPEGFYTSSPPTLGVASGASGFTLVEVHPETRQYSTLEGLPEQALVARLWSAPTAPLYMHASVRTLPGFSKSGTVGSGRARREGAALAAALAGRPGQTLKYDGPVVDALLQTVRLELCLPDAVAFKAKDASFVAGAPRPLFLSAAMALGVVHSTGVPDLLASLLPRNTPRAVADALRGMLLSPPPERVARSLLEAHRLLRDCTAPLPSPPLIPSGKLSRLIAERECSANFLAEIETLCAAVGALRSKQQPIFEALLAPAQLATGNELRASQLVSDCAAASDVLKAVLSPAVFATARSSGAVAPPDIRAEDMLGSALLDTGDDSIEGEPLWEAHWPEGDAPPPSAATPLGFLKDNERPFRGRVRRECVPDAYDALERAAAELDAAICEDLLPFVERWESNRRARGAKSVSPKKKPAAGDIVLVHDPTNNAVRLKAPGRNTVSWTDGVDEAKVKALMGATDRFGRPDKSGRFTTSRVDKALDAYRRSAEAAEKAVLEALQAASAELEPFLASLVGAAEMALYLRLATEHTREAMRRGWCLPQLLPEGAPWRMRELTPPWMDRAGSSTVSNDMDCTGMMLLTGPNMAGKSTLGRAAGSAALLANCGLHVPAALAEVPRFRYYFVRMASSDSPAEGLSHWGLDMKDAAALADASAVSAGTCVVLDETCQGTEVAHATAMAGCLLELLDNRGARGIFATHLHGVLTLPLALGNTTRMAMQTELNAATGALQPTWRLVEGECTQSLAFEVAADCGLPRELLERAERLLQHAMPAGSSSSPPPPVQPVLPAQPAPRKQPSAVPPRPPPLSFEPKQSPALRDAATVLLQQCATLLSDGAVTLTVLELSASEQPPPATVNRSAVYMLRVTQPSDAVAFYVGESDDLLGRLQTHRRTHAAAARVEAAYVLVPSGGGAKSKAREVEASTINAMRAANFQLLNDKDGGNKAFGK